MANKPGSTHHGSLQLAAENVSPKVATPRWHQVDRISAVNWDRAYPYQLLVLRKQADGTYSREPGWSYTLPIPPQSLQLSMPVASRGRVTLGGYVEQRGGVPIRHIVLRGTTGVLPLRGSSPVLPAFNPAQAIFAGTVQQALRVGNVAREMGGARAMPNLLRDEDVSDKTDVGRTSGYYQWRLLYQFLERYHSASLTDDGRHLRLALAIWKDEAVYLVTQMGFDLARQVPQVYEYPWTLDFKAHRRVELSQGPGASHAWAPVTRDPDAASRALKVLSDSRRVVAGAKATLHAVVSDVERSVLGPLREATLLLKDVAGVPASIVDFAPEIVRAAQGAVVDLIAVRDAYEAVPDEVAAASDRAAAEWQELAALGRALARRDTGGAELAQPTSLNADPALRVFDDPEAHLDLLGALRVGELRLDQAAEDAVAAARGAAAALRRADLEDRRASLRGAYTRFAAHVGLGSDVVADLYGLPAKSGARRAVAADLALLAALDRAAEVLDKLAAGADLGRPPVDAVGAVAGLAARSGIAFTRPVSKRAVPFPAGWTLERLAAQYLGDPDRWHEIAVLNGLAPPWVDEEGFDLPLLVPSRGDVVALAPDPRLRAGEVVYLASRVKRRVPARILRVDPAGDHVQVLLDRALDGYDPADLAVLHAWLPDTVRAGQAIYVPSQEQPSQEDYDARAVVGVDAWDPLVRVAGVDLLLDTAGDLVVGDDGDAPWATGLACLTQQVRLYLSLEKGALLQHPEVGLALPLGANVVDADPEDLAEATRELVASDPSFGGIRDVAVVRQGNATRFAVTATVRGWDQLLPAAVEVVRSGA